MTLKEPRCSSKPNKNLKEEEKEEDKIACTISDIVNSISREYLSPFLETSAKKYKTKTNVSCFSPNRGDSSINEENGEVDKLDRSLKKMRWNRIGGKKGRKGERTNWKNTRGGINTRCTGRFTFSR